MLPRREADRHAKGVLSARRRKIAPLREGLHRWRKGGDRRRGDRAYSRDRGQPARGIVDARTSAQFSIQIRNLPAQSCDLIQKQSRRISHRRRQRDVVAVDDCGEASDMGGTGRRDDALFGQMSPSR
mgnify:CR=1 FL=1|jgi:hypothetical protein